MKIHETDLADLKILELDFYRDSRGFFVERFNQKAFRELGMPGEFVQDNHSRSGTKVLRGLHYQFDPPQGKLVGVIHGTIWDVAVDLRPDSKTYGQSFGIELNDHNGKVLWIPAGFAHGFCVLGETPADVFYKTTALYNARGEGGVRWNDPELKISWPYRDPLVSEKDQKLPSFEEYRARK